MLLHQARALELVKHKEVDVLIAGAPENVFYLTGLYSLGQWLVGSLAFGLLSSKGNIVLVAPVSDMDLIVEVSPWADRIESYGTFYLEGSPTSDDDRRLMALGTGERPHRTGLESLVAVLREYEWHHGRVGIDEQGTIPSILEGLRSELPEVDLIPASDLFREIRKVKTEEEQRRLGLAAEATERAFLSAIASAREAITEREMAMVYEHELIRAGASPIFTVIGFGPHSAYPNGIPGDRPLRYGDVIRFDIGCRYAGYFADIARTAVFGKPSPEISQCYQAILHGEDRGLGIVRAGVRSGEVFEEAVRGTREAGLPGYRRHHVGHGIGLKAYDPPLLAPQSDEALEPGMVLNIETPYYELGLGGLQVEDTVVVTADGYIPLTRTSRELYVL